MIVELLISRTALWNESNEFFFKELRFESKKKLAICRKMLFNMSESTFGCL